MTDADGSSGLDAERAWRDAALYHPDSFVQRDRRIIAEASIAMPELDTGDPLRSARAFVGDRYVDQGNVTLRHHRGAFFAFDGARWRAVGEGRLRAELYAFLDNMNVRKDGESRPFRPDRRKVADALDALAATVGLDDDMDPPFWLPGTQGDAPPAAELIPLANGHLHLGSRELWPATPGLFATAGLPFAYDPDAGDPKAWLAFLAQLWPDDAGSIDALQDWFGYVVAGATDQHAGLLLIGPKRSGKSTIARILAELIGREAAIGPTLHSLAEPFGLEPWIDAKLAVIADARAGGRADQAVIAERLLSATGEDAMTVGRKHRAAWTGRLAARVMLLSNEVPRIADASGAMASRFMVLRLTESFLGREDRALAGRLLDELPAILNWSLDGWGRLRARGRFMQPDSGKADAGDLADLGAPVAVFVGERCEIDPFLKVRCSKLYNAWRSWCEDQGKREPGTAPDFGRHLKAAFPAITRGREPSGDRARTYIGIDLAPG